MPPNQTANSGAPEEKSLVDTTLTSNGSDQVVTPSTNITSTDISNNLEKKSKKVKLIIAAFVILVLITGIGFYLFTGNNNKLNNTKSASSSTSQNSSSQPSSVNQNNTLQNTENPLNADPKLKSVSQQCADNPAIC